MSEHVVQLLTLLRVTAVLTGVHASVTSLEQFTTRERFRPDGLMSWDVMQFYSEDNPILEPIGERLFSYGRFRWILAVRLISGLLLIAFAALGRIPPVLPFVLFFTYLAISYRQMVGLDGAFHMGIILTAGLFLATLFPDGHVGQLAAVVFMAIQATLSYFIAGVSKLVAPEWRNGEAMEGIFSTKVWGNERVYRLLRRYPKLNFVGAWTVILFEVLFPVVLVVDQQWTLLIFAIGIAFHAFNAVFMGLNTFLIMFPASYPILYYANLLVHQHLL